MKASIDSRIFYHIYPLGMCGCPPQNDFSSPAGSGLREIEGHLDRIVDLGVNALYIGPLFESTAHGYDTLDYFHVDRRLGNNDDLKRLVSACHDRGIAVVLDAVLNHVGRHFFAFKDLQQKGRESSYQSWFAGVDFSRRSPAGDPFHYEGWSGHYDLVKLNTGNPDVANHLFSAVKFWMEEFHIDGLRLDAADVLEGGFMDSLSSFCRGINPDFWLMGEVVHGDYRNWARPGRLDSVTNYEAYKGLWSSFNDKNMFEIAWSLNRQFGNEGMYRDFLPYNFADNHDVPRVASVLKDPAHLYPLYGLLAAMPGIPSVYYGSEWGLRGEKKEGSDRQLRPRIESPSAEQAVSRIDRNCAPATDYRALEETIRHVFRIRKENAALRNGGFVPVHTSALQYAFIRSNPEQTILAAVNADGSAQEISVAIPEGVWQDLLDASCTIEARRGGAKVSIPANWIRLLRKL
ncbi:alpha-amylase [Treponema zuelzerae]|uniref:Alpha-amylase n=1 Tax=Teretinema zuelzerae TaxID=156 RepID=A0AAE3EKW5_9SPIR|nr:alpha-amylase family glycosyl hydrolase [Teretinema zuelzerae]MCD1655388.1 alpha-amylase [Teretinema zuelzerae]